jgi:hypothetical protein
METPIKQMLCLSKFSDFEIKYKDSSYYYPSIILAAISPVVAEKVKNSDFHIELPSIDGQISHFASIITGEKFEVNEANAPFFFSIGSTLQIKELMEISSRILFEKCDKGEIVALASLMFEKKIAPIQLIEHIASNIDIYIKSKEFMTLDLHLIEKVFSSKLFTCKDNTSLFKYIVKRYPENPGAFARLIRIIGTKYLDPITLPLLLSAPNININDFKEVFIPIIFCKIDDSVRQSSDAPIVPISYEAGNEMFGLIRYFKNRFILNSSIEISATSEFSEEYGVKSLLDDNPETFYSSLNGPISDIIIYLKNGALALTQYTLMSSKAGKNSICPISWIVSGSNDNTTWVTLDSHNEDKSLCFENKAVTFIPKTKVWTPYSYFKISQIESGGKKNNRFVLAGIELFGAYTPLK